jgi:hypothetical protein
VIWGLRLNVWIIRGKEKTTKQEIKIIYMGRDLSGYYIEDLVFSSIIEKKYIGKKWIWTTLKMATSNYTNASFLIAETSDFLARVFKGKQGYFIPNWMHGEINIQTDLKDIVRINKSIKNEMRKIRKYKLEYELTKEQVHFNNFYYGMYLPYLKKRYSKEAILEEYNDLQAVFKQGELMLIKKDGIPVAGHLIEYRKNKAILIVLGIKDGDLNYLRLGVVSAIYYYSIKYSQGRGFARVNLGSTRAFLRDGVLLFKRNWSLNIVGTSRIGFLMKPLLENTVVRGFLLNNPFLFKDSKHVYGAVFISADQIVNHKSIEKIFRAYYLDGMSKLLVYVFDGTDNIIQMIIPNGLENKVKILKAPVRT